MQTIDEFTFEITNFCHYHCVHCSSDAGPDGKEFIKAEDLINFCKGKNFKIINISGGEPLCHPQFASIHKYLESCLVPGGRVIVYSNLIRHLKYNVNVIPEVIVEANVMIPEGVNQVNILKKVNQGREKKRPKIHLSRNWDCECNKDCGHNVMKSDGKIVKAPCKKEEEIGDIGPNGHDCPSCGHWVYGDSDGNEQCNKCKREVDND